MGQFKTDSGGIALKANVKILTAASTWNTRLSQIARQAGAVLISTYSLPRLDYACKIFSKRSSGTTLLVNSKFRSRAKEILDRFPDIEIYLKDDIHAKLVLIEPETVYLGSDNFGSSKWFETTIGIKSKEAYKHYKKIMQGQITGAEKL